MGINDLSNTELLKLIYSGIDGSINKWGEALNVDIADAAAGQVIWPVAASGQLFSFLDSPVTATIQSDSANDTLAGTGAQKVKVTYHTPDNEETVVIELNGLTGVEVSTNFMGCFRVEVIQSGSGNTNAGNITVESGGTIYTWMTSGEGQTQMAITRIPFDENGAYLKYSLAEYARSGPFNSAQMRLRIRKLDGTIVLKADPTISVNNVRYERDYKYGGIKLEPGDHVYWECVEVSANDTQLRGEFDIISIS